MAASRSDAVEGEPDLDTRCRALVADLGLGAAKDVTSVTPLSGGVASDIARVVLHGTRYCAKFALARLRVAQDWRAPVHRSRAEYAWLSRTGSIVPGIAPRVVGYSDRLQGFLMEDIAGPDVYLWKTAMLSGASTGAEAASIAAALAQIHAAGAAPGFDRTPFNNAADFRAIRTDPYLRATAIQHPDLAPRLLHLADAIDAATTTLVHGDVSPKNILIRHGAPVLLDAECATMGDPAFDVAFCLNHLALKAAHLPASRAFLLASLQTFWASYSSAVPWEHPAALEVRIVALQPALMLARIDGKSPVEYLSDPARKQVRATARRLVATPPASIAALVTDLKKDFT